MIEIITHNELFKLLPGDILDLGKSGLVVYYNEEEAKGIRIIQAEHQRQVREAINFVESKKNAR